jgi:hypothetical protein
MYTNIPKDMECRLEISTNAINVLTQWGMVKKTTQNFHKQSKILKLLSKTIFYSLFFQHKMHLECGITIFIIAIILSTQCGKAGKK